MKTRNPSNTYCGSVIKDFAKKVCFLKRTLAAAIIVVVLAAVPGSEKRESIRIFFLGDSITGGVGVSDPATQSFVALTGKMLTEFRINATLTNLGISGEKSDGALARLKKDVISEHPDVVVIMYGTNDAFVDEGKTEERLPLNEYKRNMANIVRQLIDEKIKVIMMTPVPLGNRVYEREPYRSKGLDFYLKPYVSACREIAENHKVMLADNFLLWEEKGRLGHSMDSMLPDGVHPDEAGHNEIARLLFLKVLRACMIQDEYQLIVEGGKFRNAHWQARIEEKDDMIGISGVFGFFYANYLPGKGDFTVSATFRIDQFNQAEPAFILGDSEFGFYDDGKRLALSGRFSGYRNTFLSLDSAGIDPYDWMDLVLQRTGNSIQLKINGIALGECFYLEDFQGKTGFKPGRALLKIRHFSLEGNLLEVSVTPKSFTIPLKDISGDSSGQVVVDREKDQYLGHPTTVLLEDNETMFAVYPKGHGGGALVLKKSRDAGRTWSERLPVPQNWETSREVPTIYRTIDAGGKKRLLIFSGLYPVRMALSEDDGESWSPLKPVFSYGGVVVMSDMVRKSNGDYITFFHDDGKYYQREGKKTNEFFVYKTISSDGGISWSDPEVVTHHKSAHLCEAGYIASPDGTEWALLLRENSRNYNSMVIFSRDEGDTWTEPVEMPASLTGDRHQLLYAPDGRLVAVFRDMAELSPTKGDFVGWVGAWDDLKTGAEGQYRIRLLDNKVAYDCGYPGFELLPDGTFAATTYGHWQEGEAPYIVSVRFRLDELDKIPETEKSDIKN